MGSKHTWKSVGSIVGTTLMPGLGTAVGYAAGKSVDDKNSKKSSSTNSSGGTTEDDTTTESDTATGGEDIYASGGLSLKKKKSTLAGEGEQTFKTGALGG